MNSFTEQVDIKTLVKILNPPKIIANFFKESAEVTGRHLFLTLLFNVLFSIVLFVIYFVLMLAAINLVYERKNQNLLLGYMSIPFVSYFACGVIRYYLRLVRKLPVTWKILFKGHRGYIHIVIIFLGYYSLYVLFFKALFEIGDYDLMMQLRLLTGAGFFFWITVRLIFATFFVIDADYSFKQAIKASLLLTSGRTIKTLALLSISSVVLLSGIVLSVGASYILRNIFTIETHVYILVSFPFIYSFAIYAMGLVMSSFVMSYDINLNNKYSRRKKLITEAALITKQKIEQLMY